MTSAKKKLRQIEKMLSKRFYSDEEHYVRQTGAACANDMQAYHLAQDIKSIIHGVSDEPPPAPPVKVLLKPPPIVTPHHSCSYCEDK